MDVKARMLAGLPVDDASLRFLLVPILQANDLSDLLIENGGKFLYQQITVTFTLKETGDVVGMHQLIFGGKTVKCEPKIAARCSY